MTEHLTIGISICRALPDEAEELSHIAFRSKAHWGYPEEWLEYWRPQLTIAPDEIAENAFYIARCGSEPAGFYGLDIDGALASLEHTWVDPVAMGRGVGSALFRHAAAAARKRGCSRLQIESDPHAEAFYRRMGAVRIGVVPAPVAGRQRELPRLVLELGPHGRK